MSEGFYVMSEYKLLYLSKIPPSLYFRRAYTMVMVTDIYYFLGYMQTQLELEKMCLGGGGVIYKGMHPYTQRGWKKLQRNINQMLVNKRDGGK